MIGSNEATPKQIRKNVERIGWIFIINKLEHLALAGVCLAAKFMKMNEEMVRATSDSLIYIYIYILAGAPGHRQQQLSTNIQ